METENRTRNKVESESKTWSYEHIQKQGTHGATPVTITDGGEFTSYQKYSEMTDVVTFGFEKLSGEGRILNNPMTQVTTIDRDSLFDRLYSYKWNVWDPNCVPGGEYHYYSNVLQDTGSSLSFLGSNSYPTPSTLNDQALKDSALAKAWARTEVTDIQSMVMVAESRKTVLSLISIFSRFIKVLKKIKRLDVKGLTDELSAKELSDRYMELRYAIRPLMYDAKGVITALNRKASETSKRLTFRAEDHDSDSDSTSSTVNSSLTNFFGAGYGWSEETTTSWERSVEVRAGVLTALDQLNTLNIWGMTQPMESLWELVPFSFIVDWFFNVGDTISAWTPNYGLKALASWYVATTRTYLYSGKKFKNSWHDGSIHNYGNTNYQCTDFTHIHSDCWIDQTKIEKLRVPNPERNVLPTFNLSLNAFKLADLVIIAKKIWR